MKRLFVWWMAMPGMAWGATLSVPDTFVTSTEVTIAADGLTPDAWVTLFASRDGLGAGPCLPAAAGACLHISHVMRVRLVRADATGRVVFTEDLPARMPGTMWLQMADTDGVLTDVVQVTNLRFANDEDEDGLVNGLEVVLGTDLYTPDSDDDRLLDGPESILGTDALDPDSDGDGLLDGMDVWPFTPGPFDAVPDPTEVRVSDPSLSLIDPEFDTLQHRIVWQTAQGDQMWVGGIDPLTGDFVPASGRGTLLDTGLARITDTANGPEWVYTDAGPQVLYTKLQGSVPVLGHAWLDGTWQTAVLAQSEGQFDPYGSLVPGDATPWVRYRRDDDGVKALGLRQLGDDSTDHLLPTWARNGRWSTSGHLITAAVPSAVTPWQIYTWDPVLRVAERLTTDIDTGKDNPFFLDMPEYGGETGLVLSRSHGQDDLTRTAAQTELALYRKLGGVWQPVHIIPAPPGYPRIWSPEPFTWQGRSYVLFNASNATTYDGVSVGHLWVASLDPAGPLVLRRVCGDAPANRRDPEAYTAGARPWLYFTTKEGPGHFQVYRCDMGL